VDEIEILQAKQDNFNIYKKVKELAGLRRKDQNGKIIKDIEEKNMKELYEDDRDINRIQTDHEDSGMEITDQEVIHAVKTIKDGKATNELPCEILTLVEEENIHHLKNFRGDPNNGR